MNFEEITYELSRFLHTYKFEVKETSKNFIKYESKYAALTVGYDFRDNSISTSVGKKGEFLSELIGDVLTKFFDYDTRICNDGHFTENLIHFLNGKGDAILNGDLDTLNKLEEYSYQLAVDHTNKLVTRQNLNDADIAWTANDYFGFVKSLDKVEQKYLPESYLKKYQIATKKIK